MAFQTEMQSSVQLFTHREAHTFLCAAAHVAIGLLLQSPIAICSHDRVYAHKYADKPAHQCLTRTRSHEA